MQARAKLRGELSLISSDIAVPIDGMAKRDLAPYLKRDLDRNMTLVSRFRNGFRFAMKKTLRMTFAHDIYRFCAIVARILRYHKDDPISCSSAWLNIRMLYLVSSVSHTSSL